MEKSTEVIMGGILSCFIEMINKPLLNLRKELCIS